MLDVCRNMKSLSYSFVRAGQSQIAEDIEAELRQSCIACTFGGEDCFDRRSSPTAHGLATVTITTTPPNRRVRTSFDAAASINLAMQVAADIGCRVVLVDERETTVVHRGVEHCDAQLF